MAKHARVGPAAEEVNSLAPVHEPRHGTPASEPRHAASPGVTPAGMRVRRRKTGRIVGVAALAVVVGLVASALIINERNRQAPDRPATQAQAVTASAAQPPTTTAPARSPTATPATVTPSPAAPSPVAMPPTAPGVTEPGILLTASPESDGTFDVLERVRLGSPVTTLTLRPAPVDRAGQQFASVVATATQVQLSAGDEPVVVPAAMIDTTTALPVPQVDQFELRYRLTGVTIRSTPSTAGRALAAFGPLTAGVGDDLPVLFIVSGGTVLGLNCPLLPLSQQSCGSHAQPGPALQHELPARLALVTVQFNLPSP